MINAAMNKKLGMVITVPGLTSFLNDESNALQGV